MQITVKGKKVNVDDAFSTLTREEQDAVVDDIVTDAERRFGASAFSQPASAASAQQAVQAPDGLVPGSPAYAKWASEQARAGKKLPQVSDLSPKFAPERDSSLLDPYVQGTTFGFSDEIRGAVQGGLAAMQGGDFGDTYRRSVDQSRNALDYQRRVNPVGSAAAEIGGAVTTGIATGGRLATQGATTLGRVGWGSLVGGTQGAVYGAGAAGDSIEERAQGAALGGAGGAVLGGAVPAATAAFKGVFGRVGAAMPEIDDLYKAKNAAYAKVDNSGFRYTQQQFDDLVNDIYRRVGAGDIDPNPDGAHKAAISMLNRLNGRNPPRTLTQLDDLRQVIYRDVIENGSKADGHFGRMMLDAIDDFIDTAGGAAEIGAARAAHKTLRKSELLAEAVEKAHLNAASTGSGGNIDNALRQQIKAILTNPSRVRNFTQTEREMMDKIIRGGGNVQKFLRLVGKLSPSGNGLMAALGVGATAANPMMAVPVGMGIAAKTVADGATKSGVRALENTVRRGAGALPRPMSHRGLLERGAGGMTPYLGPNAAEGLYDITIRGGGNGR